MSKVEEKQVGTPGTATSKKLPTPNTFEGKVVSMVDNKLVMTNLEGKQYSHTLTHDAQLTCDGLACKAEDLTAGLRIRVTTKKNDRRVATCIEALSKNAEFRQS